MKDLSELEGWFLCIVMALGLGGAAFLTGAFIAMIADVFWGLM